MDYICDSTGFVGAWVTNRIHDGRHHPCPAGHRHCCDTDSSVSRTKTGLTRLTITRKGEVLT